MSSLVLLLPGRLDTLTGGYGYDRCIVAGLRDLGWSVTVCELDDSFPFPTRAARDHATRRLAAIEDGATVLIDGLALGAMAAEAAREATRLRLVALVHHPLAAETGLDRAAADALYASERGALAAVRLVVVTSQATARALAHYHVASERIVVIEPGTERAPLARGSVPGLGRGPHASGVEPVVSPLGPGTVQLLSVAAIVPRKGHEVLFRALASIPERHWRLSCVGSVDRDPVTVTRLRAQLGADRLADRVSLAGEMDGAALDAQYAAADVFVLPTFYEGYGMAVAESLARGIPVISTPTGAIADLVSGCGPGRPQGPNSQPPTVRVHVPPDQPAGLLVPPGDASALAAALSRVIGDREFRLQLAAGARRVRERLPTWTDAAAKMAAVLGAA